MSSEIQKCVTKLRISRTLVKFEFFIDVTVKNTIFEHVMSCRPDILEGSAASSFSVGPYRRNLLEDDC
jgi:hypothetical protein